MAGGLTKKITSNKGDNEQQLNISKLTAGVYALRLHSEKINSVLSFVRD